MYSARQLIPRPIEKILKVTIYDHISRQQRELHRLRALPRYTPATTKLLGKTVDLADAASFLAMYEEIYRRGIYRFRASTLAPFVIDGGSNIGISVLYFKQLYPHSRVIGFEPDEGLFALCSRNVEHFGCTDVTLSNTALWTSQTQLQFVTEGGVAGRLARGQETLSPSTMVRTSKLRDYLHQRVDLLKLDVEGAETELLVDCADLLCNVSHIFVEYHSFEDAPQSLHVVLSILAEAGFRLHMHPSVTSPRPFMRRQRTNGMDFQVNIFGFRSSARDGAAAPRSNQGG